ncbi:hypothetical protein HYH03_012765 [Edaphochlamys debaryana]|uniref:tRNA pseudouridine synthase n=1 Tax=Edaphochlamys debaryana TaxID=47281 RepID=A0A835XSC4_9CHLO|nr:hypothetical protein HYH03_012765 [Edaphochlamys debaryana]|eukprot:KAG2488767.1 hypothetical protein HYH03_012765 [Edaphochlamys debaryana]
MVGASRTDGGAHAHGQVVHFDVYGVRDNLEEDTLYYNSFLPPDVRVLGMSYADPGFDCHFSSCGKTYTYRLSAGLPDPLQARYRWDVYERWCTRSRGKPGRLSDVALDVGLMQRAAEGLLGRHDFTTFADAKRPAGLGSAKRKNPKLAEKGIKPERTAAKNTRILTHLTLSESVSSVTGGQEVTMTVTGNGFLYRMVRMLAAGLVEVGHRRITPAGLAEALAAADRSALPIEAAPPHGLVLSRVHFAGDAGFEARVRAVAEAVRARGGPEAEAEAGAIERELGQTQGQRAAALMRAAAAARKAARAQGEGGAEGGERGVEGGDGEVVEAGAGAGVEEGEEELGAVDYSKLRDRDDDQ